MDDEKKFPEISSPGIERERYEKEVKWKVIKKRKKRYKKLWKNTIPLIEYRGIIEVSYELVLKRGKIRTVEEVYLFNNFGYKGSSFNSEFYTI
jgi:hypothetical protein